MLLCRSPVPVIEHLVEEHGADVNGGGVGTYQCEEMRILQLACISPRSARVVRFLLSVKGLDINWTSASGLTALHCAFLTEELDPVLIRVLLSHPDINVNVGTWPIF